jgi:hypothetical protein
MQGFFAGHTRGGFEPFAQNGIVFYAVMEITGERLGDYGAGRQLKTIYLLATSTIDEAHRCAAYRSTAWIYEHKPSKLSTNYQQVINTFIIYYGK